MRETKQAIQQDQVDRSEESASDNDSELDEASCLQVRCISIFQKLAQERGKSKRGPQIGALLFAFIATVNTPVWPGSGEGYWQSFHVAMCDQRTKPPSMLSNTFAITISEPAAKRSLVRMQWHN